MSRKLWLAGDSAKRLKKIVDYATHPAMAHGMRAAALRVRLRDALAQVHPVLAVPSAPCRHS